MTTADTNVAPTERELRVLRAFGQRGVKEQIIADTQGVPVDFVWDTIDRWAAGDRTTAKRVVATYDTLPPPPPPEPRTPPKKKTEVPPMATATATATTTATTPVPPAVTSTEEWAGDIWELLVQAAGSGHGPAVQLARKIRDLAGQLSNCLRDREDSVAQEVEVMVAARRTGLQKLIDELTAERDRLKRGLDDETVREWALANGHPVPKTGRVSPHVKRAYLVAQGE